MLTCLAYCLDKELWKAIVYLQYHHHERIHQGLNRIIEPQHEGRQGEIIYIERLGGLLKSYHRRAA